MFRKLFFLFLNFGVALPLQAQLITVLSDRTGSPVPKVLIYTQENKQSIITDIFGKVDISSFEMEDTLIFRHPSYEIKILLKANIEENVLLREKVIHTEQVVISANKWEQDLTEIPQDVIAIEAEEIQFNNPATSADLLSQSGEVYVQKSQLGGGSPSIRGFAANSILLVFDGVRMNNAIYRSGNLQNVISIDPLALEGVEVLLGTGSVIYGSDALGGVLDFHSVTPEFSPASHPYVQPEFLVRYASASQEKTFHASLIAGGAKLAGFTSFSVTDFGNLRTGKNLDDAYPGYGRYPFKVIRSSGGSDTINSSKPYLQEPTAYNSRSFLQKVRYRAPSGIELLYSYYNNTTGDNPRFDRLIETDDSGLPVYAEWYYGPQSWTMHSLRTTVPLKSNFLDEVKILTAYQKYKESRLNRRFTESILQSQQENLDVASVNIDAEKSFTQWQFYYGLEGVRNWVKSTAYNLDVFTQAKEPSVPRYPANGSTYSSAAGYFSLMYYLNTRTTLSGGVRYSHIWLRAETTPGDAAFFNTGNLKINNGALSGNLGVTSVLSDHQLKFLLSSGFRSPNIDDIGKIFEVDRNDLIVPNTNLSPEKTFNAEFSWHFSKNKFTSELTGFYTFLKDAIIRGPIQIDGMDSIVYNGSTRKLYSQVNAARAEIYGISFRSSYTLSKSLALNGMLNITDGKDLDNDEPLRHTTPLFGSIRISWLFNALKLETFVDFNGNRYRSDIPTAEIDSKPYLYAMHKSDRQKDGSPGWYTLNIRGSWQISTRFVWQLAIENILDQHFRPYSSGISAPGRNIIMSLRYTPGI